MKIQFSEHEGCFAIDLEAENMTEAAALVRFGLNRTDKLNHVSARVNQNGTFTGTVIFAKSKRANNDVPRRK